MTIEIADRLVKLRKKYGYSQEELADKLGLSRQAVSKWERAEASPDTDNLICLAKLYGVSLDELLATDEDLDTIVEEQVKEEKEEEINAKKGGDKVVINNDGIFIKDKHGKKVTINDDGVTCYDRDGKIVKKVGKDMDKGSAVIGCIEGVLILLATVAFLLMGLIAHLWDCAWIVFLIPEMICSIARAIYKKDARKVNIPFISTFTFFLVCLFLPRLITSMPDPTEPTLWQVMWVVFLAVPVYYAIVGTFHKALGKFQDEDKDDDDEDDEDDDDKEDEVVIDFSKKEDK